MYRTETLLITGNKHFTTFYSSASIKVLILCGSYPIHLLHRTIAPKYLLFCCITIIYPSQTHTKNHLTICTPQNVSGHQGHISTNIRQLQIEENEGTLSTNSEKFREEHITAVFSQMFYCNLCRVVDLCICMLHLRA
jgi:hypothetical protein